MNKVVSRGHIQLAGQATMVVFQHHHKFKICCQKLFDFIEAWNNRISAVENWRGCFPLATAAPRQSVPSSFSKIEVIEILNIAFKFPHPFYFLHWLQSREITLVAQGSLPK